MLNVRNYAAKDHAEIIHEWTVSYDDNVPAFVFCVTNPAILMIWMRGAAKHKVPSLNSDEPSEVAISRVCLGFDHEMLRMAIEILGFARVYDELGICATWEIHHKFSLLG